MVGQHPVPAGTHIGNAKHVHKVFGKFKSAGSKRLRAGEQEWFPGKEFGVSVLEHVGARTGRSDYIPACVFKNLDGMLRQRACIAPQPGVKGRLAAASLAGGEIHGNPQTMKNVNNGLARLRVKCIHKAGNEKLNVGHASIIRLEMPSQTVRNRLLVSFIF
jgi:hypothetical protein